MVLVPFLLQQSAHAGGLRTAPHVPLSHAQREPRHLCLRNLELAVQRRNVLALLRHAVLALKRRALIGQPLLIEAQQVDTRLLHQAGRALRGRLCVACGRLRHCAAGLHRRPVGGERPKGERLRGGRVPATGRLLAARTARPGLPLGAAPAPWLSDRQYTALNRM
jgi:hypothetical protein